MKTLIIGLILLYTPKILATDCNEKNIWINKKWGNAAIENRWTGPSSQIPLYDQGSTGLCYAYTATEMVDFWRETKGIRISKNMPLSSNVFAGLLTRVWNHPENRYAGRKDFNGGYVDLTINAIREFGMCQAHIVERSWRRFVKNKRTGEREFYQIVKNTFQYFNGTKYSLRKFKRKIKHGLGGSDALNLDSFSNEIHPFLQENKTLTEFFEHVFSDCFDEVNIYLGTRRIPEPTTIVNYINEMDNNKNKVRSLLNKKDAQPIGISYCSNILKNKKHVGMSPLKEGDYIGAMFPAKGRDCSGHASIIVGKKKIEGKCHYLVRNTQTPPWRFNYNWPLKKGYRGKTIGIWVGEDELFLNTNKLYYLE